MAIAIVTDSTCDLPPGTLEEYPIHVVPNLLVIDGQSLEDGNGISRQEFYERLPHMKTVPTTASASAGSFQTLYEHLFRQGYQQIISLHAPNSLSGIFNAAHLAAETFDHRVVVMDSGQVSLGLGFQAITAAEEAAKELPLPDILAKIKGIQQRIHVIAMLDTLEYVRRSGRVSWARARLGSLLAIKPFLELRNGKIINLGEARTRLKGENRLFQFLSDLGPLERLAILHTNAESEALTFRQRLDIDLAQPPILVNVTTVIGTHVGPNGLGFVAVTR
jgi:DegV family protein with EDD domain